MEDSALALRLGQHLNNLGNTRGAQEVPVSSLQGKTVGLYFSARWCSPCLKFTPKLISFYANINEMMLSKEDEDLEVVFVSTDCDQINKRGEGVDEKFKKLDTELARYKEQIKKTRPEPAQKAVKARAMRVLKQKRILGLRPCESDGPIGRVHRGIAIERSVAI
ncbi:hypothetical protein Taro_015732 [Colocasia esculenta]|uniref:protein-disulfide reductase n=1 Tax=Colocasia esculenta TaxID=4460 RepID=A0A843UQS2_COLES|nr:hypothetical protein [Colocasia esculenta]